MTRLDGEKKSPLPYIIGFIVLALVAAGLYFLLTQRGNEATDTNSAGVVAVNSASDNSAMDANTADANGVDANTIDANTVDANATGGAMMDSNAAMANSATDNSAMMSNSAMDNSAMMSNSAMTNSAMNGGAMTNSAMSNSAMGGAMSNSAMSNSAMSNSAMGGTMSNSAMSNSAMMNNSAMAPASATSTPKNDSSAVIAARSKTVKQGDTTVTYTKKVLKDGSMQRDKSIAAEPVKKAKQ